MTRPDHGRWQGLPWPTRARRGAWGMGAGFGPVALIFLALVLLEGPVGRTRGGSVVRNDYLLVAFPLGAATTGALLGVLAPVMRRLPVAAVAGVLAFIPWMAAIGAGFDHGLTAWSTEHTLIAAGTAILFGSVSGVITRDVLFDRKLRQARKARKREAAARRRRRHSGRHEPLGPRPPQDSRGRRGRAG